MKTRIFGVAVLLIATFAAVHTTPARAGGGPSSFECARFCMVALCPQPQECGLHQGPNGLQCGCFGGVGGPVGPYPRPGRHGSLPLQVIRHRKM